MSKSLDDLIWDVCEPLFHKFIDTSVMSCAKALIEIKKKDPRFLPEKMVHGNPHFIDNAAETLLANEEFLNEVYLKVEENMFTYIKNESKDQGGSDVIKLQLKKEGIIQQVKQYFIENDIKDVLAKMIREETLTIVNATIEGKPKRDE